MVTAILSVIINWFLAIVVMTFLTIFWGFVKPVPNEVINMYPLYAGLFMIVVVGLGAFTPLGEMWTRRKCSNAPCAELRRLEYCFNEVCSRAGIDPNTYSLYISPDKDINAFATGKKTVVANTGLLQIDDDDQIKGVLAHELGHHQLGHTLWLGITAFSAWAGNLALTVYNVVIALLGILRAIPVIGWIVGLLSLIFAAMFYVIKIIILIPHNLGYYFGSRRDEYAADQFAARLGYGPSLAEFLQTEVIPKEGAPGGFLAALHSTHPQTWKRVERLLLNS